MVCSTQSQCYARAPALPGRHKPSCSLSAHRCRHAHHLQLSERNQCSSSSSSSNSRLVCKSVPRPMWAAKSAPEPPPSSTMLGPMITKQITAAERLADLEDVVEEWGGSFDYIHISAALVKFSKLPYSQQQQPGGNKLLQRLFSMWRSQLAFAGEQACCNVLWACSRLGSTKVPDATWDSTWQAFMQHCEQAFADTAASVVRPQQLSNALLACAKLRKQPTAEELQLMLQLLLHPVIFSKAKVQEIANTVWALGTLQQLRGWQGGVSEQQVQLLLGEQQVRQLAMEDTSQGIANVLLSLARMSTGHDPLLSKAFAEATAQQLLDAAVQRTLRDWNAQNITNAMWACGELQLSGSGFLAAAVAAAPLWLPQAIATNVRQALFSCVRLQLADSAFIQQLVQQGLRVCQQLHARAQRGSQASRDAAQRDLDSLAGMCGWAVAELDMQQLAGTAREVVVVSRIKQQRNSHPSNLGRLWAFHKWLLRHQLLDGKGLTEVLTEQQLQQGAQELEEYKAGL